MSHDCAGRFLGGVAGFALMDSLLAGAFLIAPTWFSAVRDGAMAGLRSVCQTTSAWMMVMEGSHSAKLRGLDRWDGGTPQLKCRLPLCECGCARKDYESREVASLLFGAATVPEHGLGR